MNYKYKLIIEEYTKNELTNEQHVTGFFTAKDLDNAYGKIAYSLRSHVKTKNEKQ